MKRLRHFSLRTWISCVYIRIRLYLVKLSRQGRYVFKTLSTVNWRRIFQTTNSSDEDIPLHIKNLLPNKLLVWIFKRDNKRCTRKLTHHKFLAKKVSSQFKESIIWLPNTYLSVSSEYLGSVGKSRKEYSTSEAKMQKPNKQIFL